MNKAEKNAIVALMDDGEYLHWLCEAFPMEMYQDHVFKDTEEARFLAELQVYHPLAELNDISFLCFTIECLFKYTSADRFAKHF